MERVPVPPEEPRRLEALRAYHVLDTPPEEAFDRVTRMCARLFGVSSAFVGLLDERREWLKSRYGVEACELPREATFCNHVIYHRAPLLVEDAHADRRFAESPVVTDPPLLFRFYAGVPLLVEEGLAIGTLCIADPQPRTLADEELATLEDLAAVIADELELRRAGLRLADQGEEVARKRRELQRANLELQQAREEAERGNRAKSQFLSRMSHELRTPLNAVLGFAQVLEQDRTEPLTERQLRYLRQILNGGYHLLELVDEALDLSRIEAGRIELHLGGVEPASVIEDCLAMTEPMADDAEVEQRWRQGPGVPDSLRTDERRLRQVLLNLVGNAVRYNRPGGWVEVTVEANEPGWVRFRVADSGRGIDPARQYEIFEPFNRLGLDGEEAAGRGLGLFVSSRLVERMGGELKCWSREGEGAVFWFDLPVTGPARTEGGEDG